MCLVPRVLNDLLSEAPISLLEPLTGRPPPLSQQPSRLLEPLTGRLLYSRHDPGLHLARHTAEGKHCEFHKWPPACETHRREARVRELAGAWWRASAFHRHRPASHLGPGTPEPPAPNSRPAGTSCRWKHLRRCLARLRRQFRSRQDRS